MDPATGALRESFDEAWKPLPGLGGARIEPGHQFEWAWLLMRWCPDKDSSAWRAARALIELGEQHGVRQGFAVDALLDDLSVQEPDSRLWPQTERLKAAALLAAITREPRYWSMAAQAAQGLRRYLGTEVPGLWYDRLTSDGQFVQQSAPASSFYHIVCSIGEFGAALERA